MWMWDTSTAGDQAPHCHLGCSERRRQCSTAVAKADPPLWLPGEYIAPRWYPFLAPLLQLWHCLSSLRTLGFLWSAALWQHSCYSKQAGDAGAKARQSTWFTFPSPCLLKVLLGLSFSARWYEIISVSFLLLFTYTNFSDFFFFCKWCPFSFTSFLFMWYLECRKLCFSKAEEHELVVTTLPTFTYLCWRSWAASRVSSSLGRVTIWEKKMQLIPTLEGKHCVALDLRSSCDWYTKKHHSVTVKSSCDWLSVVFAIDQLQLLQKVFWPLGHLFAWIQRLTCASYIAAQDTYLPSASPKQLERWS